MKVSSIRVKLVDDTSDRLRAVCSVTFDEVFVIRDVKVVDGTSGLFVAMPSRKLSANCPKCRYKNHLKARYCNDCGTRLPHHEIPDDSAGRSRLHRDVAHPITPEFRAFLQETVIAAYEEELGREPETDEADGFIEEDDSDDEPAPGNQREPEVAEADDDEDEDNGPQPGNERSEFDEIIAGLGKGSGDRGRGRGRGRGGDRDRSDRGSRSGGDRGNRDGGRDNRREGGDRKSSGRRESAPQGRGRSGGDRKQQGGERKAASAPKQQAPPNVVKSAEKPVSPPPAKPTGGFGAGILDAGPGKSSGSSAKPGSKKPAKAKPKPETKKEKTEAAPPPSSTGGFGEGIL